MNVNGIEYVRELPEHGVVRGRNARITIDGVPYVREDKVRAKTTEAVTVAELRDSLRLLDYDDILDGVREMVSQDGKLRSCPNSGAHVGTLMDLLRTAQPYAKVTLDGIPVIGVSDGNLLLGTAS